MKKYLYIIVAFLVVAGVFLLAYNPIQAAVARIFYEIRFTNGLVGYWSFDGSDINWATNQATDLSGNGNTGQLIGFSTTTGPIEGIVGQALKFDSNSFVDASTTNNFALSKFTISAWALAKPISLFRGIVVRTSDWSALTNGYGMRYNGGTGVQFWVGNGVSSFNTTVTITPKTWNHLVLTFDGTNGIVYLNGVQASTVTLSGTISNPSVDLNIGANSVAANRFLGNIDEVRIYNRVLSSGEIAYQYQRTAPQFRNQIDASQNNKFTKGLVGYWSFDGTDINWATNQSTDWSGGNHTGQLINMSTSTNPAEGVVGQTLKFNGTNSYVTSSTLSLGGQSAMTVSAWINLNALGVDQMIVSKNGPFFFRVGTNNKLGNSSFVIHTPVGWNGFTGNTALTAKTWYHVALTFDGTNMAYYINGVQDAVKATTTTTLSGDGTLFIGASSSGGFPATSSFFNGKIDEVRIYNRALSSGEIYDLYRTSAPSLRSQINANQNSKNTGGLVGFWSFNGPDMNWSTGIASDLSGQGNSGTLSKMSTSTSPIEGIIGQALKFNGVNNYISATSSNGSFDFGTGNFSLSLWVKTTDNSNFKGLISKGDVNAAVPGFKITTVLNTNKVRVDVANGVSALIADLEPNVAVVDGAWHNVVFTGNRTSSGVIYVDGLPRGSQTFTDSASPTSISGSATFQIGVDNLVSNRFLNGIIDEVRIYNRALSAGEVYELWRSGKR